MPLYISIRVIQSLSLVPIKSACATSH